jgi:hypothetical protein
MSWEVQQEQLNDFKRAENQAMWDDVQLDQIIERTIPIYTIKNLNPKSGKEDCPITKREKERFRHIMKTKLLTARTEEDRQKVIDDYKQLFEQT